MVRTRFAPSPTGFLHIGSLRTALYSYALAKSSRGQFLLRIEDTDQKREMEGAVDSIFSSLNKFGISWDEPPVIQSQRARAGVYIQAAEKLVLNGQAFYCQCEARNAKVQGFSTVLRDPCRDKNLTKGAIKLRVPDDQKVSYHDFVLDKEISWDTNTVADTTLLKSESMGRLPTYHLAVVVDDVFMQISHALRGHDWLPSTPVHLLVYKFLGFECPEIGHLTDIQSSKGGKLSKRKDSVFCEKFLEDGYLPEALMNFVMLLGWAPKDNREMFTLSEFVEAFDPKGFQKSNPLFLSAKLDWFNGQYIRRKSDTELIQLVKPYMKSSISDIILTRIMPLIKDRLMKLTDINNLLSPFEKAPENINQELFAPNPEICLASVFITVKNGDFESKESLNSEFKKEIERLNVKTGDYFMNMRVALMGSRSTPPVTESAIILGKDESLRRISKALELLNNK
jgi:glutamyl-tRNA synthetase